MRAHVLIIDDDAALAAMLEEFLQGEGLDVSHAADGAGGLERVRNTPPDAVVLDVMLPDMSGFDVLRTLRGEHGNASAVAIPVIMLTARGEDTDRIIGLELGADDYLPKPFNPRELAARLRAVLRRTSGDAAGATSGEVQGGDLQLDSHSRRVRVGERLLRLTGAEFAILERLLAEPGEVVSRDALSEHALGRRLTPFDRSVDTHVSRLRSKLGPLSDGEPRIQSQRGRGYRLVLEQP